MTWQPGSNRNLEEGNKGDQNGDCIETLHSDGAEKGFQTNVGTWENVLYLNREYDAKFLYDRTRKRKNKRPKQERFRSKKKRENMEHQREKNKKGVAEELGHGK